MLGLGGGDDDLLGSRRLVGVWCWVGGGMMTILQETFALDLQLLLRDTLRRSRPCAWERSWTSAATTHARSARGATCTAGDSTGESTANRIS